MVGDKMVEEARTWLGTTWHHQACLKGVGVDCVGLIRASYESATKNAVNLVFDYHRMPIAGRENRLEEILSRYMKPVDKDNLQAGDVMLFHFLNGTSNHLGIYTYDGNFIHAWLDVQKVVEMPLSETWARSIKTVFRIPEVMD